MIRTNVGREGRPYFPFIFSLFYFILIGNMLGMMPYGFTFTSHLAVTLGMALVVFIGTTVIGFIKHGLHFLSFFLPHGTPIGLAPLLIPLEIMSYCFRPISLSLRLFANMTAGHTLLKVFAGFVVSLGLLGVIPLLAVIGLTGLEFLVAFLQAYVYTVLACIYLNDAHRQHLFHHHRVARPQSCGTAAHPAADVGGVRPGRSHRAVCAGRRPDHPVRLILSEAIAVAR
jgi:F-type H+-transporting ATPase subunit a